MTRSVEVALPVRRVSLSLNIGAERSGTPLEDFVARGVLLGIVTVRDLEQFLLLSHNVILDVVHSLWAKGHLVVDFQDNRLELTDSAREVLGRPDGTLSGGVVAVKTVNVLFEPVTGKVLHENRGREEAGSSQMRLPVDGAPDIRSIPSGELLEGVSALYGREEDQALRHRILSVNFGSPVLRPPDEVRWVHVRLTVSTDPGSGRLVARVAESERGWDLRSRRKLSQHVSEVANSDPRHPFSVRLRRDAGEELVAPDTADDLLHSLADLLPAEYDLPMEVAMERHRELTRLARRIEERVSAEDAARAEVTLVHGGDGTRWAVRRLVQKARQQLFICWPVIAHAELNQLLDDLRTRLQPGVLRLVVLWGRRREDSLSGNVLTALEDLRAQYPEQVLYAEQSAAVQANFVVQDDRSAWLGATGPLAGAPPDTQIGVLIEPADGGPSRPQAVQDLLHWGRDSFPSRREARTIAVYPDQFGTAVEASTAAAPVAEVPLLEAADEPDRLRLWAAAWREYPVAVARSRFRAERIGPVVEVLTGGQCLDRAWDHLRVARRRVVLGEQRQDVTGLPTALREQLELRAGQEVSVQLAMPPGHDGWLDELQATGLQVHPRTAAPLLVADNVALLGLPSLITAMANPGRPAALLSVAVSGASIADQLVAIVTGGVVEIRPDPAAPPASASRSAVVAALPLLQEARRAAAPAQGAAARHEFGRVLVERLPELDQPSVVFDGWRAAGVPDEDLRTLAAAVLMTMDRSPASAGLRRPVLEWLLVDDWRRHHFVEAAVLAGGEPGTCQVPTAAACLAAVPLELGPSRLAWGDLARELSGGADSMVAVAGALADVLVWNGLEATTLLAELAQDRAVLSQSWREVVLAALEHAGTSSVSFPLAAIMALVSDGGSQSDNEERWAELATRIDAIGQRTRRFSFTSGQFLQRLLFEPGGLLADVRAACEGGRKERQAMLDWLPPSALSHCTKLLAQAGSAPMVWTKHRAFLNELEDILRSARANADDERRYGAAETPVGPAAVSFARCVEPGRLTQLWAEAEALPYPYDLPVRELLGRLEPVSQWARLR